MHLSALVFSPLLLLSATMAAPFHELSPRLFDTPTKEISHVAIGSKFIWKSGKNDDLLQQWKDKCYGESGTYRTHKVHTVGEKYTYECYSETLG